MRIETRCSHDPLRFALLLAVGGLIAAFSPGQAQAGLPEPVMSCENSGLPGAGALDLPGFSVPLEPAPCTNTVGQQTDCFSEYIGLQRWRPNEVCVDPLDVPVPDGDLVLGVACLDKALANPPQPDCVIDLLLGEDCIDDTEVIVPALSTVGLVVFGVGLLGAMLFAIRRRSASAQP